MEDSEDGGIKEVSVSEDIITVKTLVSTAETVINKVVEGGDSRDCASASENVVMGDNNGGASEGGDVMVEILGSDVFVDGVRGGFGTRNEDGGSGSSEDDDVAAQGEGESGNREDGSGSESLSGHLSDKCIGGGDDRTNLGKYLSSYSAEVKSDDPGLEVQHSMSGIILTADGKKDVSTECVEAVKEDVAVGGSCEVLREQESVTKGDAQNVTLASADYQGNELRDGNVNGAMELVDTPIMDDKRTCVDSAHSSAAMGFLGPEEVVTTEQMQELRLPDQETGADISCEPVLEGTVVSNFAHRDSEIADTRIHELSDCSVVLEHKVAHISGAESLVANLHSGYRRDGERQPEGDAANGQLPVSDVSDLQELGYVSETSLTGCIYSKTDDGVAQIGTNFGVVQEVHEAAHGELLVSVDDASPIEHETAKSSEHGTVDVSAVQEVPHNTFSPVDASTKEDDCAKLSAPGVVSEFCSNVQDTEEVRDEPTIFHSPVAVGAANFAQAKSNIDDVVEMKEKIANGEGAVFVDNASLDEERTSELRNQVLSADADTQENLCLMDVHLSAGPFIMETEGPDEPIAGSADENMVPGPIYDENVGSGAHSSDEQPPLPDALAMRQGVANHAVEVESNMEVAQIEPHEATNAEQVNSPEEQEVGEDHASGSAKSQIEEGRSSKRAYSKAESLLKDHRVSYQLPPEIEGEFSVFDLVWGKVKSHPWWPGQIFHPSDSSEKAMKYYRKDSYLVAYFGDRTFAWNEASVLKPFGRHFTVAERQNKTESFQNAVNCALEEVSRRTELGLACSCISEEAIDKIRYQIVENTGIREESSKRDGVDRCTGVDYFHPGKFVEYIRSLAVFPTSGADRLDLVIARAQLLAFHRYRGSDALADFQYYEGLTEEESDVHSGHNKISSKKEHEGSFAKVDVNSTLKGPKRKHNLKDIVYQRRKEKSMTELMGEYYLDGEFDSLEEDDNMLTSPTSGMKRKASGVLMDDFTSVPSTKTIALAKVSQRVSSNPQQSFKVGECIRRVAGQLTGSSSIAKGSSDGSIGEHLRDDDDEVVEASKDNQAEMSPSPSQQSSLDEMLSQLHLTAENPEKAYSFLGDIIRFFGEFRVLAVSTQRQQLRRGPRKRKSPAPVVAPETFEFDDKNDSYWTDMVVQDNAEAKPSRRGRKRKNVQGAVHSGKPPQSNPRKNSRKQYFHGSFGSAETSLTEKKQQGNLPTELILSFTETGSIPSDLNINKMFRRFGPLKESETKIDTESRRARLVFKKRSDAEVAYSSAAMFNVFGSTIVNYQLNYVPSDSFSTVHRVVLTEGQENAT